MPATKTGLTPQDVAQLIPAASPAWTLQGSYTPSALGLPPMGGRIIRLDFTALAPGVGDAVVIEINNVALAPIVFSTYASMAVVILGTAGVQGCWAFANGVDIVFQAGSESVVELTTAPAGALVTDISEGVEVSGVLRASALLEFSPLLALLAVQDIPYTATLAMRGVAGNSVTITYVVAGLNTALSVAVVGTAITVNLATDGAGAATSTATLVLAAIKASEAASRLVTASITGNPATVQVAAGATPLAGGAASTYTFRVWGMPSSRNAWELITDAGPLRRPTSLFSSVATGISASLQQTLRLDFLVDGLERIHIEPVSISAGAALAVRIGPCAGTS